MTNSPVLPAEVQAQLSAVGLCLEKGESVRLAAPTIAELLSTLPATAVSQAARVIVNAANLSRRRPDRRVIKKLFRRRLSDEEQLRQLPELAYLFIFHADGRIREAALQRISGALPSPFLFAAVVLRLNDWAEPVRVAAVACAKRCFPLTSPDVIAAAAEALLLRQASWRRWSDEREVIEETFARTDVASAIATLMCRTPTGPSSRVLRSLLKRDAMDRHLTTLVTQAAQPSVRAVALQTLVSGEASWIAGTEWKWIDKSMGHRIRLPRYECRALSAVADQALVVASAATDRSAIVRRTALAAIIAHRLSTEQAKVIAERLKADTSRPVRERAQFILAKRGQT